MKHGRRKVTFTTADEIEAVTLAQLGMSTQVIQEATEGRLSAGQIQVPFDPGQDPGRFT